MAHWRGERNLGVIHSLTEPRDGDMRNLGNHEAFYLTLAVMAILGLILIIGFML